jgi:hypothetical protein
MKTRHHLILGIDPGPRASGMVLYDPVAREVVEAWKDAGECEVRREVRRMRQGVRTSRIREVVIEKVSAGPKMGASLLETQLFAGRVVGWCEIIDIPCDTYYRRDVIRSLGCTAKKPSRDSQVRATLIERHGGSTAIGKKGSPGPLYGVASHAWQALGLVYAHAFEYSGA